MRDTMGASWTVVRCASGFLVGSPDYSPPQQPDVDTHAQVLLWDMRANGKSLRALQYGAPLRSIRADRLSVLHVRRALSRPRVHDLTVEDDEGITYSGSFVNLHDKLTLMFSASPPPLPDYGGVPVGIFVDGTTLWKRNYQHMTLGALHVPRPLGSWALLHGPEKKAVLRPLCTMDTDVFGRRCTNLNTQLDEALRAQYPVQGGFERGLVPFLIADAKGHCILANCSGFTSKREDAVVCWCCGANRAHCLAQFSKATARVLPAFTWGGALLPAVGPRNRVPDYGLHGLHRVASCGLLGVVRALRVHHRWSHARARKWVQALLLPCRIASHSVAEHDGRLESLHKKQKKDLAFEQSAALRWVKDRGWRDVATALRVADLLDVPVSGAQSWVHGWEQWGKGLSDAADLIQRSAPMTARDLEVLKSALALQGAVHVSLGLTVTIWAHLWVDHLLEYARIWKGVSLTSAFRGEERHKSLKSEIRFRSFKGGAKFQGKEGHFKGGRFRKGYGELIRNDNLDWSLLKVGLDTTSRAWTKQELYKAHRKYWRSLRKRS